LREENGRLTLLSSETLMGSVKGEPVAELRGQVAIISGALGDIGRACAVELARRGADVACGGRSDGGRSEPLLEGIRQLGRRGRFDVVDVADAEAVGRWVESVADDLGLPTLAIPNAAFVQQIPIRQLSGKDLRRLLDVNLLGAFHLAQSAALRLLAQGRPGRIVFIGSWAAHAPHAHVPAYCVAKAGLRMLCQCMALEYAPHGILVNEVAPGFVDAGLSRKVWEEDPEFRTVCARRVPVGNVMTAEEVAIHVAHLCDPRNRNMAGSTLLCDGGLSLVSATSRGLDER
jgi:NAD(P)-dependent dehydrogenase (short-subunit alcohol dehydrogenase family)